MHGIKPVILATIVGDDNRPYFVRFDKRSVFTANLF